MIFNGPIQDPYKDNSRPLLLLFFPLLVFWLYKNYKKTLNRKKYTKYYGNSFSSDDFCVRKKGPRSPNCFLMKELHFFLYQTSPEYTYVFWTPFYFLSIASLKVVCPFMNFYQFLIKIYYDNLKAFGLSNTMASRTF